MWVWIGGGLAVWLAASVLVLILCRMAAAGDAMMEARRDAPQAAGRGLRWTLDDAAGAVLDRLDVDHVALFVVDGGQLALLAGRRDGSTAAAAPASAHLGAAEEAIERLATVELMLDDGAGSGGLLAAEPMLDGGRAIGAVVVSSTRLRPSLTFTERRAVRALAAEVAALLRPQRDEVRLGRAR
jgi:hypothetical protein